MQELSNAARPLPAVGAGATRTRVITEHDVARFAEVSGDNNPLHPDADYAAQTPFGRCIAHGFLTGSLISALIGTEFPGPGSIYLGQTLKFLRPVFPGESITVSVEVSAVRAEKRLLTLRTDCTNQDGALVLAGEAIVKYQ